LFQRHQKVSLRLLINQFLRYLTMNIKGLNKLKDMC
jgi:hypothetical protein